MLYFLISLCSLFYHPFYISVTEIKHSSSEKAINISSRIFTDDLENVLKKQNRVSVNIAKPANKLQVNKLINDYVKRHLSIIADGKPVNYTFLRYEIQEDGTWCYFSAKPVMRVKSIHVRNNLLAEEHEDQINVVHVTLSGNRQTAQLNTNDTDADFPF